MWGPSHGGTWSKYSVRSCISICGNHHIVFFSIIVVSLWAKLNKLRKRYERMLNGAEAVNVEQILIDLQQKLNDQEARNNEIDEKKSNKSDNICVI